MNDEEIIQSAEKVRLAEIKLEADREQRKHEKWRARHEIIHGIFHPRSEEKGFAYFVIFAIIFFSIMGTIWAHW